MRYSTNLGIEVLNHESGIMNYDFPATVRNLLLMIQNEKLPRFYEGVSHILAVSL